MNNDRQNTVKKSKDCAIRTTQTYLVESCPPEECGVHAPFDISYL